MIIVWKYQKCAEITLYTSEHLRPFKKKTQCFQQYTLSETRCERVGVNYEFNLKAFISRFAEDR